MSVRVRRAPRAACVWSDTLYTQCTLCASLHRHTLCTAHCITRSVCVSVCTSSTIHKPPQHLRFQPWAHSGLCMRSDCSCTFRDFEAPWLTARRSFSDLGMVGSRLRHHANEESLSLHGLRLGPYTTRCHSAHCALARRFLNPRTTTLHDHVQMSASALPLFVVCGDYKRAARGAAAMQLESGAAAVGRQL